MFIYIPSNNAIDSKWLILISLARIKIIVLTSVHQASHLQTFYTQRFFINNNLETTERSRSLDSILFYSAAALNLANYTQSLTNPTVLAQVKPHLLKRSANSYRISAPRVFRFVTGQCYKANSH